MAEIVVTWLVATLVLPFLIGWALGHPGYAAAVFAALGLSTLVLSLQAGEAQVMQGLGVSFLLSSVPAYVGGRFRGRPMAFIRQRRDARIARRQLG